jgi:outer membrane biosynthesis protein TonB
MIELLLQAERAMSVGLVDRAEVLYAQVAEADPQNSIAVVGLARVALERGDEAGALALARRALTIDPENAAAARMVERLDEVLAYRGESAATTDPAAAVESVGAPEVAAEDDIAPEPVTAPEPTPTPEPDRTPEPAPTPESSPAPEPPPTPAPTAARPPTRPSLLARLFGRFRRR